MRDAVRGAPARLGWTPAEAVQRSDAPAVAASWAPRKTEGCITRLALIPISGCASRLALSLPGGNALHEMKVNRPWR